MAAFGIGNCDHAGARGLGLQPAINNNALHLLSLRCVLSVAFFVDKAPPNILRVRNKLFTSHWMLENGFTRWSKDFKFGRKFHCKN